MPSVFLFSFSLLLLSFPSYHLRAPSLHGRDAVHKVRGLALVRLLFFCSSKVREKEDKALRDFAVSGEFADAEKKAATKSQFKFLNLFLTFYL